MIFTAFESDLNSRHLLFFGSANPEWSYQRKVLYWTYLRCHQPTVSYTPHPYGNRIQTSQAYWMRATSTRRCILVFPPQRPQVLNKLEISFQPHISSWQLNTFMYWAILSILCNGILTNAVGIRKYLSTGYSAVVTTPRGSDFRNKIRILMLLIV